MRASFVLALLFMLASTALSQPTLISVVPNTVTPGQAYSIAIAGLQTHFAEPYTTLSLGDGIKVTSLQVNRHDLITATIEVAPSAAAGPRTARVTVTNINEAVELPNAITVITPGGELHVAVTIIPVEVLRLSDFDPNNKANAPLLFSATVYNNMVERHPTLLVKVVHEKYGLIITGTRQLGTLQPGEVKTINNKEIETYTVNPAAKPYISDALLTGLLPAGNYTYRITLLDEQGQVLAEDAATSLLTNPSPTILLVGPGSTVGSPPGIMQASSTPFFQWISSLPPDFELDLFEVREGQSSPEDIQRNVPVYRTQNITQTSMQYPNSAQVLEAGKTYAWQVSTKGLGDASVASVKSEMFWFTLVETGIDDKAMQIFIDPREVDMVSAETMKFVLRNHTGLPIPPKPVKSAKSTSIASYSSGDYGVSWSIVPPDGGTIDEEGNFTAGDQPGSVAVIARLTYYSKNISVEDYATVQVYPKVKFEFPKLLMEMFGKKPADFEQEKEK
jgi:hypothetical protein